MSVKNYKKMKHRFVQLTVIISEIYYSKKSDAWMMRGRASIGHFFEETVFGIIMETALKDIIR